MWAIFKAIAAFFQSVTGVARVVEKAQPSPEERMEKLEIEKPLAEVKINSKVADRIFNRIKNNPQADILAEIRTLTNLSADEETALLKSLEVRLNEHREKHPFLSGMRRFERNKRK